jgi:2-C-methyl-D-erythritol 4-phosphate cytidylyltransferase
MEISIIIVAGGSGTRMGSSTPKQFLGLAGRPVLMHTIEKFSTVLPGAEIILVLPQNQLQQWEQLIKDFSFNIPHKSCVGGETRFQSVKNGLEKVNPNSLLVGVHDGVRPLVSSNTIKSCISLASEKGSAIPVVMPADSIRRISKDKNIAVTRDEFRMVQTPQVFKRDIILSAYQKEFNSSFTDDASVVEAEGFDIFLCDGNYENIKITTPSDLIIAEALLKKEPN